MSGEDVLNLGTGSPGIPGASSGEDSNICHRELKPRLKGACLLKGYDPLMPSCTICAPRYHQPVRLDFLPACGIQDPQDVLHLLNSQKY